MQKHSRCRFYQSLLCVGVCLAVIQLIPMRAAAQGDGPRAYFPAPVDLNLITGYGLFLQGNKSLDSGVVFPEGDLDMNVGVVQYTRSLGVAGQSAGLFAVVPAGEVSGTLAGSRVSPESNSSGLGDVLLGGAFCLYGMPAMTLDEYPRFDPGFALAILTRVSAPSGEYDSSQPINLGANRWSVQLGVPIFYYVGESLLDEDLTTFEFLPSVTLFTDNDDPFGGDSLEQDPLFRVEAHVTRNINRAFWLSIDGLWTYGGETAMDGQGADNTQRSLSLGGTAGVNLSPALSVKASYGEVVDRNDDGPDGRMFRLVASVLF